MSRQKNGKSQATELQVERTLGSHLWFQLCQRKAFQMSLEGWSLIPPQRQSATQVISRSIIETAGTGSSRPGLAVGLL